MHKKEKRKIMNKQKTILKWLYGVAIILSTMGYAQRNISQLQPTASSSTTDSDGDGIMDELDKDDDNDGILDSVEAFVCGVENASFVILGSEVASTIENASIDSYAQVTAGLSSAGIIATYARQDNYAPTQIGRVVNSTGPNNLALKVVQPQYSDIGGTLGTKVNNGNYARVVNYAFRRDKFDVSQPYRKLVIEYDWRGESNPVYNEWGTYISNGKKGTVYTTVETEDTYSAITTYRSGFWLVINKYRHGLIGQRNQNAFKPNKWYRIKTEYILLNDSTLRIKNYMTEYDANGSLNAFTGQDTYSYNYDVNLSLADYSWLTNGFEAGIMADSDFANVNTYWEECDSDGDRLPNRVDLDSDNDGCGDAVEGTGGFSQLSLVPTSMSGGNVGATSGDYFRPFAENLGQVVSTTATAAEYGVPTIAGSGQAAGNAYNATLKNFLCTCFKDANTSGAGLITHHGITLLKRAGETSSDWPMSRKGAWTVLESNTKGLVLTRMTTAQINAIASPQEGMITYDTEVKCIKVYNGTKWSCFNAPACLQ